MTKATEAFIETFSQGSSPSSVQESAEARESILKAKQSAVHFYPIYLAHVTDPSEEDC